MNTKYLALIVYIFFSVVTQAQVTADFSSNTNSGCPNPLLVIVSDFSTSDTGVINSWTWQIDGPVGFTTVMSSTDQISTSLSISGLYTVTLTACDNNNVCDTKVETNFIEVFELPSYTYSISSMQGCAPQEICFDVDVIPGCGTTASVLFDVNDGVVYNMEDFCHAYNTIGEYYDFTFSTQNSCGCVLTETISDTIAIADNPITNFTANQNFTCIPPLLVNFTNTSTASSSATYLWNIPGEINNISSTNLMHSFGVGNYDVELITIEPEGCSDTLLYTNMISVGNPIANFGSIGTAVCPGENIQFNDSSNGIPTGWFWEVVGTPIVSSLQNPSLAFINSGSFDIRLTTSYVGGCQDVITKAAYITVHALPVNNFTVSDSGVCLIPFNTSFNSSSTNSINTVWSFPGGTPSSATGMGPINVSYANFGNYNIIVSDTSINACYFQTTFNNVITISELMADIVSDNTDGCMPVTASLMVTTNNVDSISSYTWNLPGSDIGTSNLANPTAIYNTNTCFDVEVIVVSNLGCADTVANTDFICAGIAPIANFEFTPISTCFEEEDICFTFTGSGADSLFWNFDDGPSLWTGPLGSPCHAYISDIGDYSPSIIAFNYNCSSDTIVLIDSVSILGPIAVFNAQFESCADWNTFNFTNSSVEADSSYWVFGDPSVPSGLDTSTIINPTWVYPSIDSIKNYTITLIVYNFSTGCDHTTSQAVSVYPPNAEFTVSDTILCTPNQLNFQNTSLDVTSPGMNTLWNYTDNYYFGPIGFWVGAWHFGPSRNKMYNTPGVYTIIMSNQDSRGCLDTIRKQNLITAHGAISAFNSDITEGCFPLAINFYDSSYAPLSYINSWHWNFGTGNLADTSNSQNPSFIYSDGGSYNVTLTVRDSMGCGRATTLYNYIYVHEPLASFLLSDTFICSAQNVAITNLSVGETLSYDWQFQNGTPATFNPTGNPPNISFAIEGNHNLYLEVTDNMGCLDDTTIILPVFDVVADGFVDVNYSACSNPPLLVNFTNTSYNNIDASTAFWNFGNGVTSTDFNPSTLYSSPGDFIVTLAISSLSGCRDTIVVDTIVVEGPWGVFEAISPNELCACDTALFAIKTINAINPTFLTGDGQAIPFSPIGLLGDTIYDTLKVAYCTLGNFSPSISFSQGSCSYSISSSVSDSIKIDSIVSNFSFQNAVYCDTGTVCFTDLSENELNGPANVNSWQWDFGDGNVSIVQNPCNFYNLPGVYNVCLTVSDSVVCQKTFCDSVVINSNPIATIGLSDSSVCLGDVINFYDSSIISIGSVSDSVFWNFGTGNSLDTSMSSNASFTFSSTGLFNVSLEVYDNFGCSNIDSFQNQIYSLPVITTSADTFVCIGDSVQLNVSGANSYFWTPNIDLTDNLLSNPLSYSTNAIEYFVTGIDLNGCSNIDSLDLTVSNVFANFNFSAPCATDSAFFTDLSVSNNANTNIWEWNFNDPTSGLDSVSILQNPSHIFNNSGIFDVLLSVENDKFCTADTLIQVNVSISPESIFESDSVCLGLPISFSSLLSTNGSGIITQTSWDFGTGNIGDTSNLSNPSFTYATAGLYTVCLTVTSDLSCAGNFDDTCMTVQIYNPPLTSESVDTVCLGNVNNFIDLTSIGDAAILSEYWNFDQNIGDTILIPGNIGNTNFTFTSYGSYDVVHVVTDVNLCKDSSVATVLVYDNPVSSFNFESNCLNVNNIFTSMSTSGLDGINTINQFSWDIDEGASFNIGTNVEMVDFNILGIHVVSLITIDGFGCRDTSSQNVNVLAAPIAQIVLSDNDPCEGEIVNLDASTSSFATLTVQYAWDENYSTGIDNTVANYNISPSNDVQIMLIVTDDNTCSDTAFSNIVVHENPVASFTNNNGCIGLPLILNSTSSSVEGVLTNFDWLVNNVTTLTGENTLYTPLVNGVFDLQLMITNSFNCIDSSGVVTIIVDSPVLLNLSVNDTVICAPDQLPLEVVGTADKYLWLPENLFIDNTLETVLANIENTTTITVTGYSENDYCPEATESLEIILAAAPSIEFTATPNPIFVGLISEIELDVFLFNTSDSIIWEDNTSLNVLNGPSVEASPTEETDYPFTVIYYFDSVRCVVDSFVRIQVLDECSNEMIYVQNVFTPNNDGKNDVFGISGISVSRLNYLRIYDRWGILVYEIENTELKSGRMKKEDSWDGNNAKGIYCNNGVYVIMYEAICVNGSTIIGNGNVTLIR